MNFGYGMNDLENCLIVDKNILFTNVGKDFIIYNLATSQIERIIGNISVVEIKFMCWKPDLNQILLINFKNLTKLVEILP
jgi:hypothetical protein